jgi:hypothetical protein
MISPATPQTEIDILAQMVAPEEPSLESEFARWVLGMRFGEDAQSRIRGLLDRNNRGELSEAERSLLDKYLRVGQFIDLLQAKARVTLRDSTKA